jgi:hypothetical protein
MPKIRMDPTRFSIPDGAGGNSAQKLHKSFQAMGLNSKLISHREVWCDGYIYRFNTHGYSTGSGPEMIRCSRCP